MTGLNRGDLYLIRGIKVMLVRDLVEMYGIISRRLREQVKRNIDRFPSHVMFQLTDEEANFLLSQTAPPSNKHFGAALYGLFVKHFKEYQVYWTDDFGKTYFFQCEGPYDAPNQAAYMKE